VKQIAYTKEALKTLRGMPKNRSRLIVGKIEELAKNPAALANQVTKLQGRDGYRLRVGDWRVIFTDDAAMLSVLAIGPRGDIYR
jgi:mRNA interferase RelE/StbE